MAIMGTMFKGEDLKCDTNTVTWVSLRLPVCLTHEPKLIAAACVMLSYRLHRQQFPDNKRLRLIQLIDQHFDSLQGNPPPRKSPLFNAFAHC